jgi:Protein of unknown function (DUF4244)
MCQCIRADVTDGVGRKESEVIETQTEPAGTGPEADQGRRDLPALTQPDQAQAVAPPRRDQRGMVSAEWAVGILAAIAIAGVLLAVVTNGKVEALLLGVVLKVIGTFAQFVTG